MRERRWYLCALQEEGEGLGKQLAAAEGLAEKRGAEAAAAKQESADAAQQRREREAELGQERAAEVQRLQGEHGKQVRAAGGPGEELQEDLSERSSVMCRRILLTPPAAAAGLLAFLGAGGAAAAEAVQQRGGSGGHAAAAGGGGAAEGAAGPCSPEPSAHAWHWRQAGVAPGSRVSLPHVTRDHFTALQVAALMRQSTAETAKAKADASIERLMADMVKLREQLDQVSRPSSGWQWGDWWARDGAGIGVELRNLREGSNEICGVMTLKLTPFPGPWSLRCRPPRRR